MFLEKSAFQLNYGYVSFLFALVPALCIPVGAAGFLIVFQSTFVFLSGNVFSRTQSGTLGFLG